MESKKINKPFYALPEKTPTSSQIVSDARSSLCKLNTRRPNTPRDEQRHLFPFSTNRTLESRPPSSFSLTSRHFDGVDSRPPSGTKLSPLDHHPKPVNPADLENVLVPRPPSADQTKPVPHRTGPPKVPTALSLYNSDSSLSRSGQMDDFSCTESSVAKTSLEHYSPDSQIELSSKLMVAKSHPTNSSDSRSGSAESRKSSAGKTRRGNNAEKHDTGELNEIYSHEIEPIVAELAALTKKKDCDHLQELSERLYTSLEHFGCFTKQFQQRSQILKVIFRLLDIDEPRVLLKLCRLILAEVRPCLTLFNRPSRRYSIGCYNCLLHYRTLFKVSGNNLLNVCKLVFKVSRSDKNDLYFLEDNILNLLLETIHTADHVSSCEALIYCVGAIKFLSGNSDILKRLAKLDCVKTLAALIHSVNKTNQDNGKPVDQYGNILVQLTAALRNLADTSSGRDRFLTYNVIGGLVHLMNSYPGDSDLMLYISRIFSKITLHADCCSVLANQPTSYRAFVSLLKKHLLKDDLIVRLCFVLGNLTIKNDSARLKLYQEADCTETLLLILKTYFELDQQGKTTTVASTEEQINKGAEGEMETELNKVEDVLIKVMRVLANLSINEDVGHTIASNANFTHLLLSIIEQKDISDHEELVVNATVAINNMSYYTVQDTSQMTCLLNIAQTLIKLIMNNNMEGILEAARVFGNLTRHKQIRDFLSQNKVDAMMITLLDSGSRELVYIACGVLINCMLDEEKRPLLKKEGGIKKLIDVLRDFGREDWQLSGSVCKVLVNYSSQIHSSTSTFGQVEATELSEILAEYLDKECALGESLANAADVEMREYIEDSWHDEFCQVGTQLLKRIESHSSPLEPLEAPS